MGLLPAKGYRVFWGSMKRASSARSASPERSDAVAENEFFRIELDPETGGIASLLDKRDGRQVFAATAASAQVIDERHCDTWAHGVFAFDKELGRFRGAKLGPSERGPVRSVVRASSRWSDSTITQEFALYEGLDRVDVAVHIDWREKHAMLKLAFPAALSDSSVTYEIPYGSIDKSPDGLEEPAGKWADLLGVLPDGRPAGVAIINTGKYSYDAKGPCLRLTALRSPLYADHYGRRDGQAAYMDQGEHHFTYSIYPHAGDSYRAGLVRAAYELNVEPKLVAETYHKGSLPRFMRSIDIDAPEIIAEVLKESEDGSAYILRCYETTGSPVSARLSILPLNRSIVADFKPFAIKTFRFPKDPSQAESEIDMLELGGRKA
jgi:alpha-mannosidase